MRKLALILAFLTSFVFTSCFQNNEEGDKVERLVKYAKKHNTCVSIEVDSMYAGFLKPEDFVTYYTDTVLLAKKGKCWVRETFVDGNVIVTTISEQNL